MLGNRRIPIPWSHRWRWLRYQAAPVAVFATALLMVVWLWNRQLIVTNAVGEVYAVRVDVANLVDGVLIENPYRRLELFDQVQQGELLARLDDRQLRATLGVVHSELAAAKAQLEETREQMRLEDGERQETRQSEARRLAVQVEELRLTKLQNQATIETDRAELQRLDEKADLLQKMRERAVIGQVDLLDAVAARDTVAQRIKSNQAVIAEADRQIKVAQQRLEQLGPALSAEVDKLLAPIQASAQLHESRLKELQVQLEHLEIRAPIGGRVAAIYSRPGQTVRRGDILMVVATEHSDFVVSYIRQNQRLQPAVGMEVGIRPRTQPSQLLTGHVDRIGSQVELIPQHLLRDPRVAEWGLPVRILLPRQSAVRFQPGELVDLKFNPATPSETPAATPTGA